MIAMDDAEYYREIAEMENRLRGQIHRLEKEVAKERAHSRELRIEVNLRRKQVCILVALAKFLWKRGNFESGRKDRVFGFDIGLHIAARAYEDVVWPFIQMGVPKGRLKV